MSRSFLGASLILLAGVVQAQPRPEFSPQVREFIVEDGAVVALRGVRVVDGTGAPARDNQTILIRDGRIAAVGRDGEIAIPSDAKVHRLAGTTVIPGLVDLHAHQYFNSSAGLTQMPVSAPRLYLGLGVTTIRTAGGQMPYDEINTKRDIDRGRAPGPRMHISGPYLDGPGNGPARSRRLETPDEARRVISYWAAEGATWLKFSGNVSREVLGAAIQEAHRHGMGVTGHLCSVSFREAARLGIDNLEHGFITNSDYVPNRQPDRCSPDNMVYQVNVDVQSAAVDSTIRELLDNKVALTSTLAVYELFVAGRARLSGPARAALAPRVRDSVEAAVRQINSGQGFSLPELLFRKMMEFERRWVAAGGLLAAGVDPWGNGMLPGYGSHRNFELLLEAGFSPETAIRIVTANGATVLREGDQYGTIETGKRADLVVLDRNPIVDPTALGSVRLVFRDGIGYDSAKLVASVAGMVGVR